MREKILKVKDFVGQGRENSLTDTFKNLIYEIQQKNKGTSYIKYSPNVDSKVFHIMLKTQLDEDLIATAKQIYTELLELGIKNNAIGLYFHRFLLIPGYDGSCKSKGIMAHIKKIDK